MWRGVIKSPNLRSCNIITQVFIHPLIRENEKGEST